MSRSRSRESEKDGESGSFCTTVEDLMETSRSREVDRSKGKETVKKESVKRPSLDARRRYKSGSHQYVSRSPSRSPSSSQSRSSLPAMHSKSKNRRHRARNSRMPKQSRVISEQQLLPEEGIDIEFKSLSLKAEDELSNRHRNGEIYDEVSANLRSIKKRLKHISNNNGTFSIDEAIEISDAAFLLKILRKAKPEIEMAGKMAHRGALLMIQADLLKEKGRELLVQSKHRLRMADL